jgi:hypothetical protein
MKATWPCAVPIPRHAIAEQLELWTLFIHTMSTSNAQRLTSKREMVIADLGSGSARSPTIRSADQRTVPSHT